MKIAYPILIDAGDDKTAWGITFPDLPGCFSAADTEEEVLDNAREALLLHLEALNGNYPEPSSIFEIEAKGQAVSLVDVDLSDIQGPAKRINITIPAGLLARIDAVAHGRGMTRSAFLAEAAAKEIR